LTSIFFFQAEDGIRDRNVTGVQTCALPISEHSSARLERFLQMAGENNLIVANVTSAAQFFHLLRRQAKMQDKEEARPLVVMSPKSLLRNERVASEPKEFAEGKFLTL